MRQRLESFATLILVAAALAVATVVVRREFFVPNAGAAVRPNTISETDKADWVEVLRVGTPWLGDDASPITIAVFSDMECPYCRQFEATVQGIAAKHPAEVRVLFVHFPLPMHRFAAPASRVVECARTESRFTEMVSTLYSVQDSLGLITWGTLASRAGLKDTARIEACARRDVSSAERIKAGMEVGQALGIRATPSIVVNGWLFAEPPSSDELEEVIEQILGGTRPTLRASR